MKNFNTTHTPPSHLRFDTLGIAPRFLEILHRLSYAAPTPIQYKSIPPALEGKDIMGIAQTGTGKTLAFCIPMIQRIAQSKGSARGLVLLPTRELALQVHDAFRKIGNPVGVRTAVLIGGENMQKQIRILQTHPHVIIGTPGRLNDHIQHKRLVLDRTSIVVLDEADRMLDMGFAPQIKTILQHVPQKRQTLLFSATMPSEVLALARSYMSLPLRIEVAPSGSTVESIDQELFFVKNNEKLSLLATILAQHKGSALIFCRTKSGVKKLARAIRDIGEKVNEIHSNRSLRQRIEALEGFKIGRYRVLVATDIAARGIDVKGIQMVINYDLPDTPNDYVHRIGRTGRAGLAGHAISFATSDQRRDVIQIERVIKKALRLSQTPLLKKIKLEVPHTDHPVKAYQYRHASSFRSQRVRHRKKKNHNSPNTFYASQRSSHPRR